VLRRGQGVPDPRESFSADKQVERVKFLVLVFHDYPVKNKLYICTSMTTLR